ncbi:Adenylate cyclase, class 3 [Brevibacterium casei CIP 102111]|uniref:Adenylate cyclase, class 3 n=2 Tax=Brevibacterium casei TaxID=33889 RepID=A0A2H1JW38_9MICO|nr:adenylate/guanylate cyclase domain-containing protein [Brevibacterium casei]QPR44166.1 adenylate/guanylate cyclase domain-containing protein [Brevibacterium casei]SMX91262.1 Adenylate cyclase, class 3 [Brevibacterium casei CIP 102111]
MMSEDTRQAAVSADDVEHRRNDESAREHASRDAAGQDAPVNRGPADSAAGGSATAGNDAEGAPTQDTSTGAPAQDAVAQAGSADGASAGTSEEDASGHPAPVLSTPGHGASRVEGVTHDGPQDVDSAHSGSAHSGSARSGSAHGGPGDASADDATGADIADAGSGDSAASRSDDTASRSDDTVSRGTDTTRRRARIDDSELPATSAMPVITANMLNGHPASVDDGASGRPDRADDFSEGLHEDPRTSAIDIVDDDDDDPVYETRTAAERLEEILLDGKRVLDRREAAKLGGISTVSARKMWRALGMAQTDAHDKAYTVSDAHALRMWAKPVADGLIDQETALSLARAIGQTTDRLVVWQMETIVEYLTEEKGLSEPEARREALEVIEDLIDPLQKMLTYSWRRNLAEVMGRLNVNVSDGLAMDNRQGWYDSSMPLARAVGFIDLVSYTRLSQKMEPRQLANMVQEFQGICYNIVATGGGRIIKTVGDEVFFAAETPLAGAEIAMSLMERVTAAADLPQARVGFVWGRVLSRLGDIFGSSVNLAARLTAVAEPGTIFTDEETARVLSTSDAYVFEPRGSLTLQGLGETGICRMERGTAARMKLDLDDES